MSATLTQRLRTLLRRKGSGSYGHIQKFEGVPFYEARPPWWAKFTWGFIAADLIVTCAHDFPFPPQCSFSHLASYSSTMTELTWTKWTQPPSKAGDAPVLRPTWQRAGLSLAHLSLGVGFATLLLIARSRVVRILHILPASGGAPKQLLIASAHRHGARGAVVPFSRTRIDPGRDDSEVILRIQDVRGHWWVGLTRARLRGASVPAARLRDAFMVEWGIRKKLLGDEGTGAGRWKSGPVLEN
ncbi:hypothetical protein EI94DRAFT_634833 [Lactarius quietus]|nr:hypothetical protein EI94DRAFT_634833 [Lactarius quietus]